MKTYNKEELRNLFEKEVSLIKVSKNLKNKTLNKISSHHIPSLYKLRNCAAVLLVSCICLALYLHQNPYTLENHLNTSPETEMLPKSQATADKTSKNNMSYNLHENVTVTDNLSKNIVNDSAEKITTYKQRAATQNLTESYKSDISKSNAAPLSMTEYKEESALSNEIIIGDTKEKLLQLHPNAELYEAGYKLTTDTQTIFYEISNNIIIKITTASHD